MKRRVDASIFSVNEQGEISLGRLFVLYYGSLFSSYTICNYPIYVEKFVESLKKEFKLKDKNIIGRYQIIHHKPLEKSPNYPMFQHLFVDGETVRSELEYIILIRRIRRKVIVGVSEESLTIRYGQGIPMSTIVKIINIFNNHKIQQP